MTKNKVNQAIAETQGWVFKEYRVRNPAGKLQRYTCGLGRDRETYNYRNFNAIKHLIPNYYESFDAIIPIARAYCRSLFMMEFGSFLARLADIAGGVAAFATPAQWCEAYLKALGLWVEEK